MEACTANFDGSSVWNAIVQSLVEREVQESYLRQIEQVESLIMILNQKSPVLFDSNTFSHNSGGRGIIYLTLKEPQIGANRSMIKISLFYIISKIK